eukprot:CAMPEP_0204902660 /NCGR_PEP_ID=MMETSP1397-20131031/3802_1 /ASSEMBLY_ACC=CAM_ASM_000891 /TAXON_ID=49980 /ORGANISM="Climacostomum Climacostomum virens, Strain Stock W-24" /LENGTH=692 /DNA_ID=CAMNT_0052071197 /DNA_START=69 /DNA_END=2147 /DNA_ORIENTATION=+
MIFNAVTAGTRLAIQLYSSWMEQADERVHSISVHMQALLLLFNLGILLGYLKGALALNELGILCSEIASTTLLMVGNFHQPGLYPVWLMGSLYLTFFVQADLFQSSVLKFLCYTKPLLVVPILGIFSGSISITEADEVVLCIFIISLTGVVAVYSYMSQEDTKSKLTQAFSETEGQLALVISAVPVGIFVLTRAGDIVLHNKACLNILAIDNSTEILSSIQGLKYMKDSVTEPASHCLLQTISSYIEGDSAEKAHFGLTYSEGKILSWIGQKTTWRTIPSVVVVIKDVTAVVKLERAQAESRLKNIILRSVSHELKTPTNGILHSVQAASLGKNTPPWVRDKLEIAEVSCKHLMLMIDDLIDYSMLLSEKFSLTKSFFSVREVLDDCAELMQLIADNKKISLELEVDPLVPEIVYSDSKRVSQVVLNLLSNAVKFTPKRGSIKVLAVLTDNLKLEVSVIDTGIGIAPQNISRLFHIFTGFESTDDLHPQGTGLGLQISNMLAKRLGQKAISVESTVNKGSCFSFVIDFHQSVHPLNLVFSQTNYACEDTNSAQKVPAFMSKTKKFPPVLVVDDSPFNRLVMTDILSLSNIDCAEANTGKEALDYVVKRALDQKPVKLVIMDFEMPEMNGPTACKAILSKLLQNGCEVPTVIAHTAYSSKEDIQTCLDSGMVDYLPKPSTRDTITSMISKYLK